MNLPDKLSDLLELGLRDMERFVAEGNEICMESWLITFDDKCIGCMAGAIMYCTQKVRTPQSVIVSKWAHAIDCARLGYLKYAFKYLGRPMPESLPHQMYIRRYHDDKEEFKRDIESLITLLRGVGE
jgi:hypothetical protein